MTVAGKPDFPSQYDRCRIKTSERYEADRGTTPPRCEALLTSSDYQSCPIIKWKNQKSPLDPQCATRNSIRTTWSSSIGRLGRERDRTEYFQPSKAEKRKKGVKDRSKVPNRKDTQRNASSQSRLSGSAGSTSRVRDQTQEGHSPRRHQPTRWRRPDLRRLRTKRRRKDHHDQNTIHTTPPLLRSSKSHGIRCRKRTREGPAIDQHGERC